MEGRLSPPGMDPDGGEAMGSLVKTSPLNVGILTSLRAFWGVEGATVVKALTMERIATYAASFRLISETSLSSAVNLWAS